MADAAALTVSILGNASGLVAASGQAVGALGAVESAAGKMTSTVTSMAGAALKAGAALAAIGAGAAAAGLTNAVSVAASFEQQLSAIAAVSSKVEVETVGGMKAIANTALELGKTTSFSAREAAAGMEEMVKAGVSLTDVMGGGAKAALDLAAAGALSVSEAAEIASGAMNAFALSGKDLPRIADLLANAASASATDVHQLGLGLASVGAVAHTVGLSLDDTVTALAMFAQAGMKGSDSGTSFKTMLLNLTPSTKAATQQMRDLGIITADGSNQFFDAQGKVKDFASISGILQKATAGLTQEQKLNALQTMFGTDAIRVAAIMAEKGAEGATKLADAQKDVGGASAVAKERLNNLKGAIEALSGSWEVLRIKVGMPFLPILTKGVQALTEALNKAEPTISRFAERAAAGLEKMIARAQAAAPNFLALGSGLLVFGRNAVTLAQQQIPRLTNAFNDLFSMFSGAGVSGLASGASGLAGGLVGAFRQIEPVVTMVGRQIVTNITETFTFLTQRVLPPLVSMVEQIGTVLERTLLPAAAQTGAVLRGIFGDTLDWLARTVMPPLLSIVEQTANFWTQTILPTLPAVGQALRTTLGETVQWLATDVWPKLRVAAELAWTFISGTIIPAIPGLARQIRDVLGGALQWISTTGWPMLVKGAQAAWSVINEQIIPSIRAAYDWLKVKLPEAINTVVATFTMLRGKVGPIVEAALNGDIAGAIKKLGTAFAELGGLITGWISDQVARIPWDQVWAQAKDIAVSLGTYIAGLAVDFATWLGEQVAAVDWAAVWSQAVDLATSLGTYLLGLAVDFATWLGQQVAAIDWAGVWSQATMLATALYDYVSAQVVDFATWLGAQVAAIDWAAVWAQVTGIAEAAQAEFTTQMARIDWKAVLGAVQNAETQFFTWLGEVIRGIDWGGLGEQTGQQLGTMFVDAAEKTDWQTIGAKTAEHLGAMLGAAIAAKEAWQAFGVGFVNGLSTAITGISITEASATLAAKFSEMLVGAWQSATGGWKPSLPSWLGGGGGGAAPSGGGGGAGAGAQRPSSMSMPTGAIDNSSREAFIRTAYPYALHAAGGDKRLAQQLIATAISENGNVGSGRDLGASMGYNVGGIQGVQGTAGSFTALDAGRPRQFAAYNNLSEGFEAVRNLVMNGPGSRYRPAYEQYQQTGDVDAYWAAVNRAGYAEDPNWGTKVGNIRRGQVEPLTNNMTGETPGKPVYVQMANSSGRFPVVPGAQSNSYWTSGGTHGGHPAADIFAPAGTPIYAPVGGTSRPANYPLGGNATIIEGDDGKFYYMAHGNVPFQGGRIEQGQQIGQVGNTGNARGTDPHLHYAIASNPSLFDQFNGSGDIAGTAQDWQALGEAVAVAGEAHATATPLMQETGTAVRDVGANVGALPEPLAAASAAVTDVGASVGALPEQVQAAAEGTATAAETITANFDLMRSGTLQSVTDMGTGVLTTMQDTSGNTVATVTDMAGQVTSQSATLANGVSLNMADMNVKSTSEVDTMAGTITTRMTDLAGNSVVTTTDMQGKVVGQFTTMQTTAGSKVAELASAAKTGFGQIASSADDAGGAVTRMGDTFRNMPKVDLSSQAKEFNSLASAANKARSAIEDMSQATGSKSGGGKNSAKAAARAGGGPIDAGSPYWVGEEGPELVVPTRPGYVLDHDTSMRMVGGGADLDYSRLAREIAAALGSAIASTRPIINNGTTEELTYQVRHALAREADEIRSLRGAQ